MSDRAPTDRLLDRLRLVGVPLSAIYGRVAEWRRRRLSRRAVRLDQPVISVGNLTCGGTGKTPTVEMVVRDLEKLGRRPAILSRGYGARFERGSSGDAGNDEFHVLKANLPGVAHYQGKDRVAAGRRALECGADCLVLDDGFQHVRLARDLDFVLLDATQPFSNGRVLPAGLLREPIRVLDGAGLIGLTRCDLADPIGFATLRSFLTRRFGSIPRVELSTRPVAWESLDGESEPVESLAGARVLVFSAIGNPSAFEQQLRGLGLDVAASVCFRDHHRYTDADVRDLARRARELDVDRVIGTQKDAVKLSAGESTSAWRFLRTEQTIVRGEENYRRSLDRALAQSDSS